MPKFTVDVKAFINVAIEAESEAAARAAADNFVEAMSPGYQYIVGYNAGGETDAPRIDPDQTGGFSVDGQSEVEEAS